MDISSSFALAGSCDFKRYTRYPGAIAKQLTYKYTNIRGCGPPVTISG